MGDLGTDADIESFFRVLGGGPADGQARRSTSRACIPFDLVPQRVGSMLAVHEPRSSPMQVPCAWCCPDRGGTCRRPVRPAAADGAISPAWASSHSLPDSSGEGIADGTVVIGHGYPEANPAGVLERAFAWTVANGLHELPGDQRSGVYAISGDGTVILGYSIDCCGGTGYTLRASTAGRPSSMQAAQLGGPFGAFQPNAMNFDGSVVVGQYGNYAGVWSAAGGPD